MILLDFCFVLADETETISVIMRIFALRILEIE